MSLSQLPKSHLASGRAEIWILVESGCARASSPETQEDDLKTGGNMRGPS